MNCDRLSACHGAASCRHRRPSAPRCRSAGITAACSAIGRPTAQGGTFNWMTWGDHYIDTQLKAIEASDKIVPQISELAGNAEGFAKLKEVKGELDMISGDALWVPDAYYEEGLIEPFDINELKVVVAALPVRPRVRDLDEARGLPRLPVRLVADQHLLQRRPRSRRRPTRGRCSSTRSTRAASSSRTSPKRSSPTWARRPVSTTSTT